MVLNVSSGMRAGYTALLDINKGIETAQGRLNTGKTINSAMDGAAAFLRAYSMSRRSAALSELVKGMDLGANSLPRTITLGAVAALDQRQRRHKVVAVRDHIRKWLVHPQLQRPRQYVRILATKLRAPRRLVAQR